MSELPCPARLIRQRSDWRKARYDDRLALFLLDNSGAITGAIRCSYNFGKQQARDLFAAEPWEPALPNQPWPSQDTPLSECSPDPGW